MTHSSDKPQGTLPRFEILPYPSHLDDCTAKELVFALLQRSRVNASEVAALQHLCSILAIEIDWVGNQFHNRLSKARLRHAFKQIICSALSIPEIRGKTIVELGCGNLNPLSSLMVCVMLGATTAIGIDLDTPQDPKLAAIAMARSAAWMLQDPDSIVGPDHPSREEMLFNLRGIDLAALANGDLSGIHNSPLQFLQESVHNLSIPDQTVDLVHSASVLEHIPDVDQAIVQINRILKPGGFSVHAIDGFDHRFYIDLAEPLDFLSIDSPNKIVIGCNRVRPLQFISLFEAAGFQVLEVDPTDTIDSATIQRDRLAPAFRDLPDDVLSVLRAKITVQKRTPPPAVISPIHVQTMRRRMRQLRKRLKRAEHQRQSAQQELEAIQRSKLWPVWLRWQRIKQRLGRSPNENQ
ncbi:MAG: methyltransferase domain-containing protein [Kaiparowitsia implicata GSE-PSE-MK54-09C]|nr:methyltransferase domain-containing protein [Kaiparowitsia implicata GSE-PSE-MK54-09C]